MDKITLLTIISCVSCIISVLSLIIGLHSTVKVLAMEKSTHSVQYVPIDEEWATDQKAIEKKNKEVQEDLEQFMGL